MRSEKINAKTNCRAASSFWLRASILLWLNKQLCLSLLLLFLVAFTWTLMNFPELFDIYPAVNSACCAPHRLLRSSVAKVSACHQWFESNFAGAITFAPEFDGILDKWVCAFVEWNWDLLTVRIKITWATDTILISIEPGYFSSVLQEFHLLWKILLIMSRWMQKGFHTTNVRNIKPCASPGISISGFNSNVHIISNEENERK